jgi:hypothetical protein
VGSNLENILLAVVVIAVEFAMASLDLSTHATRFSYGMKKSCDAGMSTSMHPAIASNVTMARDKSQLLV